MNWLLMILVCVAVGAVVMAASFFTSLRGMLAKILGFAGVGESRNKWAGALAGVAMMAGAAAWWFAGPGQSGPENGAGQVMPAAMVAAAPAVAENAEQIDCSCASGATCKGPRGGQYCLTGDGNKRYK